MVYKILSENLNKFNQVNFEDYKDRLVYKLFKKYSKVNEFYNIVKVRQHLDNSFVFFQNANICQLKNLEFWIETEFIFGFGWYEENRNNKLRYAVKFSETKFGELDFTEKYFDIFKDIYNEMVENEYFNFNKLFKNLNDININQFYRQEFPIFSIYTNVDVSKFNLDIQYDNENIQKIFFSFLRNDQWLVN